MSISISLTALQTAKTDIANAITAKGGTVNPGDGFSDFAADIGTITGGGSGPTAEQFLSGSITKAHSSLVHFKTYAFSNLQLTSVYLPSYTGEDLISEEDPDLALRVDRNLFHESCMADYNPETDEMDIYPEGIVFDFTEAHLPALTKLSEGMFYGSGLRSISHTGVTSIGVNAFAYSSIRTVNLPNVTIIGRNAFDTCYGPTEVKFPVLTQIEASGFHNCGTLVKADFGSSTIFTPIIFGWLALGYCSELTTLIIRNNAMSPWANNILDTTQIKEGTGYIYVPAALVNSYKAAYGWSTLASKFRAIEDYPEIAGG